MRFSADVVVELICYRRYGHNEGDEPYFTQPLMYEKIKGRKPVSEVYGEKLKEAGFDAGEMEDFARGARECMEGAFGAETKVAPAGFKGEWSAFRREYEPVCTETGVDATLLRKLAAALAAVPEGFRAHPKVEALFRKRAEAVRSGERIDWANAEALAFASLLGEGVPVRLSGQDSRRGTFNQRHCVLVDMQNEKPYVPFDSVCAPGARFMAYDSLLSEAGVLGFEYGYSTEAPGTLAIWEAQYGDFANGAQVIIDQFIVSGATKWDRGSGLVMLLPHGYEGQGAEHSSARVERFLQLCAGNNIQVAAPSTPAQYFHLLRRQVRQPFRLPLVVLAPKSLLRQPLCISRLDDFTAGCFREVLPAEGAPEKVKAVLICSGKIYFEILQKQRAESRNDVALVRLEQFYPFRADLLAKELSRFRNGKTFAWVQEEPRNMGGWSFIRPHLAQLLGREPAYVGREENASPATGSHRQHKIEQEKIVADALRPVTGKRR
jgi:2-oxoglutarate dehydrogenase E1 component